MPQSSSTPVQAVNLSDKTTPDALQNQQRVLREQALTNNGAPNLSFLSLLNSFAAPAVPADNAHDDFSGLTEDAEASQVLTEALKNNTLQDAKKHTKPVTALVQASDMQPGSKLNKALSGSSLEKLSDDSDVEDALDMLRMDGSQLQGRDIAMLQNMNPLAALPFQFINNAGAAVMAQNGTENLRGMTASKGLAEMMETAYKTQKPIRVDLSDNAALILRLGKDGRVSAEFLSANQAAQLYYSQNLQSLKDRLDARDLPYGELVVRDQQSQNQSNDSSRQSSTNQQDDPSHA